MRTNLAAALSAAFTILPSTHANAQAADTVRPAGQQVPPPTANATALSELQDIIVTAQRTTSRLQTTPLAVTAFGANELKALGITDLASLARVVPGVSFGQEIGQAHITIRGVGTDSVTPGGDPRVAYYQDGVYIARPTAQLGGLYDIEQLQVLKGPQGALYGRNATGGAIVATSQRPTGDTSGSANISYGNFNTVAATAAVNGTIAPNLSVRVAADFKYHDGYGRNIITNNLIDGLKRGGARVSLLWSPNTRFELVTIGDYHREKDSGGALHFFGQGNSQIPITGLLVGGIVPRDRREIASENDSFTDVEVYGLTAIASLKFDWGALKSVSSYRHSGASFGTNVTGTSGVVGTGIPLTYAVSSESAHQESEEIQLDGTIGNFKWLLGTLIFHERINDDLTAPLNLILFGGPNLVSQGFKIAAAGNVTSVAPYGRLTYQVTPKLSITAGARYTYEHKSVDQNSEVDLSRPFSPANPVISLPGFPLSTSATFQQIVPTATIDYKFSKSFYGYLTYGQGFKSGGINLGAISPPFKPEKNT